MTRRAPPRPTQAERTVNTGAIEQAALGTTAAAMVLGILAGETHGKTPPAAAQPHHDAPAQAPGEAFHESDHTGTSSTAIADPGQSSSSPAGSPAVTPVWSRPDPQPQQGDGTAHASDHAAAAPAATGPGADEHASGAIHITGHTGGAAVELGGGGTAATHIADASPVEPGGIAPVMPDASFLHDTVASAAGGLPAIVADATAAITSITASLGATVDTAVQSALSAPAAAAGQLVDAVFHQPAAPLTAADALIDHTPLVATVAQLAPVTLGFMGQPTTDNHDTHDGAFSALGLHHL